MFIVYYYFYLLKYVHFIFDQENLRKHVLRSGRHQDSFLYFCDFCDYKTNMATELRFHLTSHHSDRYDAKTANEAVKNHLMRPRDSKESISKNINKEDTEFTLS